MTVTSFGRAFVGQTSVGGATADLFRPEIAMLDNGRSAVVWSADLNDAVWLQFFGADGQPEGARVQVTETGQRGNRPAVTVLEDGNLLVVFTNIDELTRAKISAQFFRPDGQPIGTQQDFYADPDHTIVNPVVLGLPDGGYVLTADNLGADGSVFGVFGQVRNADGTLRGATFQVNETWDSFQSESELVALQDGGFAVTWRSREVDGSFYAVMVRTFDADGTPRGGEQQINQYTAGSQGDPAIARLNDGRLVVVWESDDQDFSGDAVYGRILSAQGVPTGSEFRINSKTSLDQNNPDVVATADGGFAVVWQDAQSSSSTQLAMRVFDASGNPTSNDQTLVEGPLDVSVFPKLATNDQGVLSATWINLTQGQSDATLFFDVSGLRKDGTAGADTIAGSVASDVLQGFDGADVMNGGAGADTLVGGTGNDTLYGGASESDLRDIIYAGEGDDVVDGGYGNDELWGQDGNDTIEGGFGVDTVNGGAGNDVLTGSAWSDLMFGSDGDDFINGGFGFDRINGGSGADRFYHLGVAGHASDWVQDFDASAGDMLVFGGSATSSQFQINFAQTDGAGDAGVAEAFVIYRPTDQILWALVDGAGESEVLLRIGSETFDLLA